MMKLLRPVISSLRREAYNRMSYSTSSELIKVSTNEDTGFTTVTMSRLPVNSMNLELLSSLHSTLVDLEKNKCQGMILTSACPTVFSSGLDIVEFHKPDLERAKIFWSTLQDTWMKLHMLPFPTVAAINGHSPAGGCLLASGCEYRVMVGPKFTIGLNEARVGIVAPPWLMTSIAKIIGNRKAELAFTTGTLYTADEALEIGLVDEVVGSKDEALQRAEEFLDEASYLPALARSFTKTRFRQSTVDWLAKNKDADIKLFTDFVFRPEVQERVDSYMANLKRKKSK